jgi:hypothetical protein
VEKHLTGRGPKGCVENGPAVSRGTLKDRSAGSEVAKQRHQPSGRLNRIFHPADNRSIDPLGP